MRKFIIIFVVFISYSSFSQVAVENVLIEMGTATWNNGCANEVSVLEELKNQGLDIIIVNYHLNDPFANQYSNARASYYGMQSVPYSVVQGNHILSGDIQNYLNAYQEAIDLNSSFVITANGNFLGDTLFLEVEVQKVADYQSDEIKLHVVLNESNIEFDWLQHDEVNDVERSMSPTANGSDLDFSDSETQTFDLEIILEDQWNPSEMEVIAFIQNDTSKQVLQCHSILMTEFSPLPVHAFFQTGDTIICSKETVAFENYSTGDVETYEWYFEGGTPETSSDEFPIVKYNEAGEFDVRLIVSNSISLDTTLKEDYIRIKELPAMGFAPLPEFCHDDPPYELSEAWPKEGNYFGMHVDTGYFHPEIAGPGEYNIYFTYEDEETTCSDTLSQAALVELCNSVKEINKQETIQWFWFKNRLKLELPEDLLKLQTKIFVYDISGRQFLMQETFNSEVVLDIPPQINQIILVVKNAEKRQVLKIIR